MLNSLDFMVLKRWEAEGIPHWLAKSTMKEVMGRFLESRERDKKGHPERLTRTVPINYLDRPVRKAWAEVLALQTPVIAQR